MRLPPVPHSWNVTPAQAREIQERLAKRVELGALEREPVLVAGVDAAFSRDEKYCIAGVVLWDADARAVVERRWARRRLRFPYVPGLLSFREAPAILAALAKLRARPDAILCDGQGLAHPRRFGIACHVGIATGIPSAGCAKSRLIGGHEKPAAARGSAAALMDGGGRIGTVLRTRARVKPVYVSAGHRMTLDDAERIVLGCCEGFRLPEPVRLADRWVAEVKRRAGGQPP